MICYNCMREKGEAAICPFCNTQYTTVPLPHQIRPGTSLGRRYTIGRVLGEGGFGITYIGRENVLGITVAIKEYYPYGYSNRNTTLGNNVSIISEDRRALYEKGRSRFLKEARILAKFQNEPGIVNVIDFLEENNTAYIVMEYLDGMTLREYLKKNGTVSPEKAVTMLMPVMRALEKVHQEGVIHRDISPDNIMMLRDGSLKLMDFGAARDYDNDNRSMSVMLKQGYAPEEQYRRNGEQGPWTDVYGLCATIYRAITGAAPVESLERCRHDTLRRPSECGVRISPALEETLMFGLTIYKEDRCPDMGSLIGRFEKALSGESIEPRTAERLRGNTYPTWRMERQDIYKTAGAEREEPYRNANYRQDPYQGMGVNRGMPPREPTLLTPPPKKKSSNTPIIIAIIISAAIIVAAIAALIIFMNFDKGENTSSAAETVAATEVEETEAPTEAEVKMPKLVGKTKEAAISKLAELNMKVKNFEETETDKQSPGKVFEQIPKKGTVLDEDTEITLYIAKAKATSAPAPTAAPTKKPTEPPVIEKPKTEGELLRERIMNTLMDDEAYEKLYCTADTYTELYDLRSDRTKKDQIRKIWNGKSIRLIETYSSDWYIVKAGSVVGFAKAKYFSSDKSDAPDAYGNTLYCDLRKDTLTLRSDPSLAAGSKKLAKISPREAMTYLDEVEKGHLVNKDTVPGASIRHNYNYHSQWVKVEYKGKTGYVLDDYVSSD